MVVLVVIVVVVIVTWWSIFGRRILAKTYGRVFRFPLSRLYTVFLHRQRPIDLKLPTKQCVYSPTLVSHLGFLVNIDTAAIRCAWRARDVYYDGSTEETRFVLCGYLHAG